MKEAEGKTARGFSEGLAHPLGASWDGRGVNFALFSANATKVEVCLFDSEGKKEISRIELQTEGQVPGVTPAAFQEHAQTAKKNCPVSKALAGTEITLEAKLV